MEKNKKLIWKNEKNNFEFYKDNQKIDIKKWNIEMNKSHSMNLIDKHPNPIIRIEERQRRKIILKLARKEAEKRNFDVKIADVGCEEGYISKKLLRYCKKIYCVDIDPRLLEIAKKNINSKKAVFVESDAQEIKLTSNSVDIAISSHVLEHLPNPQKGLKELCRITKEDGIIILNLPNEKVVLALKKIIRALGLGFLFGKLSKELAPGHLHIFDKKLLKKICKNNATIVKFKYNFPFYTNMFAILKPIKK